VFYIESKRGVTSGEMMAHEVWRRVRRPFRYPCCQKCTWEVYDANQAGCLKCGKHHQCLTNAVDNTCPLIECDDRTRVCNITGFILPEVRHSKDEYFEGTVPPHTKSQHTRDLNAEVICIVSALLTSRRARICRERENHKQTMRLTHHMHRQMKAFKITHPGKIPNVCWILAQAMSQEKYWRFIEAASDELVIHCSKHITLCLIKIRSKGLKITSGTRLQDMVCGMLYMLKHGLSFQSNILLSAIPEVDRCLPHENKIETYFGISSKAICMTENEVKLVFRESYQA
jgi:hypothetical protein